MNPLKTVWNGFYRRPVLLIALLGAILLLALSGCIQSNTRSQTRITGMIGAEPVELTASGHSQVSSGVDVSKAIAAGMAAVRGDITGALAQLKPADDGFSNGELAMGGTGIASALALILKLLRDCQVLKRDGDEAWDRLTKKSGEEAK